jgi:hypothetical protein
MEKTEKMRISRNIDTNVKIRVNDILLKEVNTFIYLEGEINSEVKISRELI